METAGEKMKGKNEGVCINWDKHHWEKSQAAWKNIRVSILGKWNKFSKEFLKPKTN